MSNCIEYKDSTAFHPGYYIQEIVEESGLTQADFAKRLDTTPKNLRKLIRGEQRLSVDMANEALQDAWHQHRVLAEFAKRLRYGLGSNSFRRKTRVREK